MSLTLLCAKASDSLFSLLLVLSWRYSKAAQGVKLAKRKPVQKNTFENQEPQYHG